MLVMLCAIPAFAQVTTSPSILGEDSKNVTITYSASSPLGNNGLLNLPASEFVYAHIGVITTKSANNSDWRYVVAEWPERDGSNAQAANLDKNRLKYLTSNLYQLAIGDIRSYFGITDETEHVKKLLLSSAMPTVRAPAKQKRRRHFCRCRKRRLRACYQRRPRPTDQRPDDCNIHTLSHHGCRPHPLCQRQAVCIQVEHHISHCKLPIRKHR